MTRLEFVEAYRHKLAGMVLDGATGARSGEQLALFCRNIMRKIDEELATMYDQLKPPETLPVKPVANGQHRIPRG